MTFDLGIRRVRVVARGAVFAAGVYIDFRDGAWLRLARRASSKGPSPYDTTGRCTGFYIPTDPNRAAR